MGHSDAVSLADMPAVDSALVDADLAKKWESLLSLRGAVLVHIETARAAGKMKAPREAVAFIRAKDKSLFSLFEKYQKKICQQFSNQPDRTYTG